MPTSLSAAGRKSLARRRPARPMAPHFRPLNSLAPAQMSRNPHEPTPETRKLVRTLAGVGQDQEDIAKQVGISAKTLRLYYREELDDGKAEANAAVIGKLYEIIRAG